MELVHFAVRKVYLSKQCTSRKTKKGWRGNEGPLRPSFDSVVREGFREEVTLEGCLEEKKSLAVGKGEEEAEALRRLGPRSVEG